MRILILAPLLFMILLAVSCKSPTVPSNADGASRVLIESFFSVHRNNDVISISEQIYGQVFNGTNPVACDSMKLDGYHMVLDTTKQTRYKVKYVIDHRQATDSLVSWSIFRTDAPDVHADVQLGAHAGVWIFDDTIYVDKGIEASATNQHQVVGDSIYLSFRSYFLHKPGTPAYFSFRDSEPIVLTPDQLRTLTVGVPYLLSIGRIRSKIESKNGVVIDTRFRYEDVKSVTIVK